MPELPEVETVKRGLSQHIINKNIKNVSINRDKLRYPIDKNGLQQLINHTIKNITRRGKHLILYINENLQIIVHLGMSGVIKIESKENYIKQKHDHLIIELEQNTLFIYNDTRRFGYWIVNKNNLPLEHPLLIKHGIEPLTTDFNTSYLKEKLKNSNRKVKQSIMDNSIVVGVGNIYASEALFNSNILPTRISKTLTLKEIDKLINSIKNVLELAIEAGGTTLKDYKNTSGKPGYFSQQLNVYGRANEKCFICGNKIENLVIAQRNTFFCRKCQK